MHAYELAILAVVSTWLGALLTQFVMRGHHLELIEWVNQWPS